MKIKTKKGLSKKVVIPLAVALTLLLGATVYVFSFNGNFFGWPHRNTATDSSINYEAPTEEQKKAGEDVKEQNEQTSKPSNSDTPPAPVDQPNGKATTTITITAANQNGGTLQIRALIGHVTNTGTCTLTLKKGTTTVAKTAPVQALASTSTCQGFDVPVTELSGGQWEATLNFENNALTAQTTKTITIQ